MLLKYKECFTMIYINLFATFDTQSTAVFTEIKLKACFILTLQKYKQ